MEKPDENRVGKFPSPYKLLKFQLSNALLLKRDSLLRSRGRGKEALFPEGVILSRGRIIDSKQFIVAVGRKEGVNLEQEKEQWKVGNTLFLKVATEPGSTVVQVIKSRRCSDYGKRYVLLEATEQSNIQHFEGQRVDIFASSDSSKVMGTIHDGGGSNSGGRDHSGQSNCKGVNYLVTLPPSKADDFDKLDNQLKVEKRVTVAILDSGVLMRQQDTAPGLDCKDLNHNGWDFVSDDPFPHDDHIGQHGSKVYSLVRKYASPGVRIMPVKVSNLNGALDLYDVLCGLEYARTHEANIINASWSFTSDGNNNPDTDFPLLLEAMKDLDASGVFVVAAAGNRNQYMPEANGEIARSLATGQRAPNIYPACYSAIQCNVITVTTIIKNRGGRFSAFENYSSKYVNTGALSDGNQSHSDGTFQIPGLSGRFAGSSFATPIVAGKLAKVLSEAMGYVSRRGAIRSIEGFHEEDDLASSIRDGGSYIDV